jgi:hypothetical protein
MADLDQPHSVAMNNEEFKAEFLARMGDERLSQAEVLHWLHDANPKYPECAAAVRVDDEHEVDDKPLYSRGEGGCWVMTWTWVPVADDEDEAP